MSLILLGLIWFACMAAVWYWPIPNTDDFRKSVRRGNQEFYPVDWVAYRRAGRRRTCIVVALGCIAVAAATIAVTAFQDDLRNLHSSLISAYVNWQSQQ